MERPDEKIRKIKVKEVGIGVLRETRGSNLYIPNCGPKYYGPNFYNKVKMVKKITIKNSKNMVVEILTLGARIITIKVPDKNNIFENVVLDFDHIFEYFKENQHFFNCLVGRVAGPESQTYNFNEKEEPTIISIRSGLISSRTSRETEFSMNEKIIGFDKVLWKSRKISNGVILSYHSKDGQMGFPGNVIVNVKYTINHENKLFIDICAVSDEPTPINITQLINMNLGGYHAGTAGINKHIVTMNTDRIIETTSDLLPTGSLNYLLNTPFDLRIPKQLESIIYDIPGGGFDHFFKTNGRKSDGVHFVGRIIHPKSGRTLEVFSNQPCFSLYTGGRLPVPYFKHVSDPFPTERDTTKTDIERERFECAAAIIEDLLPIFTRPQDQNDLKKYYKIKQDQLLKRGYIKGKNGCRYNHLGSFTVAPSWFPNGIKQICFPQRILKPAKVYRNKMEFHFGITRRGHLGPIYGEDVMSLPSEISIEILKGEI